MDGDLEGIKVELEEDARCAAVVVEHPCIVGHAVLVRLERFRARRDVRGRDDVEEVLVRNKRYHRS